MNTIWDEILGSNFDNFDASKIPENVSKESKKSFNQLTFKERDLAFQVYSEVLKCKVWFCSNDAMAKQIMNDDPEAITYTADELSKLIKSHTNSTDLESVNNIKKVFTGSQIVDHILRKKDF